MNPNRVDSDCHFEMVKPLSSFRKIKVLILYLLISFILYVRSLG
ncbi:unnamed protein product [Brassica rapa]|uniref:Uncharacterized protein n=1 Tax=Brassica campestris TaxID=3711 RepID=A0A3P5Z8Z0_BRACM|nr:unnamed protein product [Brassica rapa]VDC72254.1 unnamed protein product [Brassica rapa]